MALTLWRKNRPFEGLTRWMEEIDRWFDLELIADDEFINGFEDRWTPAVDIVEKDGKYILKADLPGVKKEDIHVEYKDGYLTLRGERHAEHEDKKKNYHRVERVYGTFERTFRVPEGINEKDIKAHYKDGILELALPVPEAEKPKAIEVKVE